MKIDTLVLSGGSTKVPAFIGAYRALLDNHIINKSLDGITHIISCSVGMLYSLMILLGVNDIVIEKTMMNFDFSELLDMDSLNINNLLFDLGLFDNYKVGIIIKTILREKYSKEDMTMKELYEITNIKLTVKVCNNTKSCVEYISYQNEPDLSIIKLLQMTTAIPLFFKPISHKGYLYADGGYAGGFAIEIAGENYIGINLKGPWKSDKQKTIIDELPVINYIISGLCMACRDASIIDKRHIYIPSSIHFTNFNLSINEKQTLIDDGYELTKQHILKYNLINDKFSTELDEDTVPNEEDHEMDD